ncbi:oligogalacturonate lyase family protein [Roseateles amylovorans]|uniref:Oligogalacturonate lyase family protein n=1 Tax=Roseateles amylovorans TaxID=2978473 RepID=A0ABY6AYQ1_9BURK|nr:oligogalacturonate lyase family protein [Roseateles amylovorans]UXH77529.1 oligogalacturonate lyase family protein [Roseateles amylovorans]
MKANERQLRFVTREDPDTGARVTRLTPTDVTCHRNYFYQKCFTNDGSQLIFGAEFGPGSSWNYHLLDLKSQTAVQLTDQPGENTFGGFLSPDDRHLYFVRAERALIRLSMRDLTEETVYRVPEGWVGYGTWVANSACTRMVGIEIDARDWFPLSDWQKFHQMFHAKPRCRLIRIDLATGEREVILEQKGWLGHPQYRPNDDQTVAYCHEGPHDLVDARMWFINEDGTNIRCGRRHDPGESCTHEFWVPDGSAMIYVSYLKGQRDRWICSLDPVTLASRRLTRMPPCSHLMSNQDGTLLIGDGCDSPADVADAGAHQIKTDPYLHLFDLKAGTERRVARHDSSWKVYKGNRQVTHPHPSFTPDERQVLFSADAEGEPALYLADL